MRRAAALARCMQAGAAVPARALAQLGLCLLIAFAAATLVDGLMRGVFASPIDAVRDLGELVVAVAISACFPLAFLEQRNIAVSLLGGLPGRRGQALLDLVVAAVVTVMMALFAWEFAVYARQLALAGETTAMLEWPKAPFWVVVDANLWLTLTAQAVVLLRHALTLAAPLPARHG